MKEQMAQHAPVPARASRRPDAHTSSPNGAGHESGLHNEDQPYLTDEQAPRQTRSGRPVQQQQQRRTPPVRPDEDEQDESIYDTRLPSSTRRYDAAAIPQRQSAMRVRYGDGERLRPAGAPARSTTRASAVMRDREAPPARRRLHPLVYVGTGLLTLATGWTLVSGLISVGHQTLDDWTYGNPRVQRTTAVVGHHDSAEHPSLFFAINDDGHAQVVECPAGDCRHAQAYVPDLLLTQDMSSTPVTIEFKDVNGDGKPDLLIHVGGQTCLWINDQGAFRPATDKDNVKL